MRQGFHVLLQTGAILLMLSGIVQAPVVGRRRRFACVTRRAAAGATTRYFARCASHRSIIPISAICARMTS